MFGLKTERAKMDNNSQDASWKNRFNKDFVLHEWLNLEPPPHMTEGEWVFEVNHLFSLLTETEDVINDKAVLVLGWKVKNGLV